MALITDPDSPPKDKVISSDIPLSEAMGTSENSTPIELSRSWQEWGTKYPSQKAKLNPGLVAALDLLTTLISLYDTLMKIIEIIEFALDTANKVYSAALAILPGVGAADGGKTAAELATIEVKSALAKVVDKIKALPKTIYTQLTNTKTDEGATI